MRVQALAIYRVRSSLSPFYKRFSSTPAINYKKRMPPKRAAVQEKKIILGRPGNNLKIGIVGLFLAYFCAVFVPMPLAGLPNVGKSSFFNALSETGKDSKLCQAMANNESRLDAHCLDLGKAANYPFATINPEVCIRAAGSVHCLCGFLYLFTIYLEYYFLTLVLNRKPVFPSQTHALIGYARHISLCHACLHFSLVST